MEVQVQTSNYCCLKKLSLQLRIRADCHSHDPDSINPVMEQRMKAS